jgi:hypothetical protein
MSDYGIQEDRGEVGITFQDVTYPMRPSYEAQAAIESTLGVGIEELWLRLRNLGAAVNGVLPAGTVGLQLRQMAVIVNEGIRAAGKQRGDRTLQTFQADRLMELIVSGSRFDLNMPLTRLLSNMLFGGDTEKKADAAPAAATNHATAGN